MMSRPLRWMALAAGLGALPLIRADDRLVVTAPAKNWVLPRFTKEGYRWMTLRGTEVREVDVGRIDIVDMNLTVFSGDAAARIDSIVLSPSASYFTRENRAAGSQGVRLIDFRYNIEVGGEQWTFSYDKAWKKISIARNVRVVIHAALPDLLK